LETKIYSLLPCFPASLQNLIYLNYEKLLGVIPALENIQNKAVDDIYIKTHSGKKNIQSLYEKILQNIVPNSEYLIIGNTNIFEEELSNFASHFFAERSRICKEKNVIIKALFVANIRSKEHELQKDSYGVNVRFLPASTSLETNYVITDNMAIFHQVVDNRFAFETNSPEIIKTQSELFKILWDGAA
jgi:hypothetical protein